MRGEKRGRQRLHSSFLGSPPHARGKGLFCKMACNSSRITPACAGKSLSGLVTAFWLQDHPRMRGEKGFFRDYLHDVTGSPPHARGKVAVYPLPLSYLWITPACAGKSDYVTLL